jgi:hypothetical protein
LSSARGQSTPRRQNRKIYHIGDTRNEQLAVNAAQQTPKAGEQARDPGRTDESERENVGSFRSRVVGTVAHAVVVVVVKREQAREETKKAQTQAAAVAAAAP